MAKQLFTNNATSTLSGTLAQGGVTLICASGEGSNFPAPTGSDFFLLTIFERDLSSNEEYIEVVKVTARTADTMTIERDVESMTGNAGGYAYPSVPAKTVYLELRWTAMGAGNLLQESDTGTPTAKGKELIVAADAAAVRTAAALGDSATKNVGTGAGTVAAGDHTHAGYVTTGANTYTGDQTLGAGAKLIFEGTTDNAYETTVDPGDPTADRTLTLPDTSGTFAITSMLGGFRNKIIGGDFTTNPWQRGTSFTGPASNTYTADRWTHGYVASAVFNILKTADAPTAAEAGIYATHCFHLDVTTADASIAAADVCNVFQRIEGYNAASLGFGQAGTRYITLSFWHKHTKTGIYCAALTNSAADRAYVAEYSQTVSDQWEKATVTIPVDTSGTWLYDSGVGLNVRFVVACGSNFHTTAGAWQSGNVFATANQVNALDDVANNFKLALVQLEAGATATGFETRSIGQELALCQRYYEKCTGFANQHYATTSNYAKTPIMFAAEKRAAPNIALTNGTTVNLTAASAASIATRGFSLVLQPTVSGMVALGNTNDGAYVAEIEL